MLDALPVEIIREDPRILVGQATEGSAGYDLQVYAEGVLPGEVAAMIYPGEDCKINFGFKMYLNNRNFAAVVIPRSSFGRKGLVLANTVGLIDSDYQGTLMGFFKNAGVEPIILRAYERVAQMVIIPVAHADFIERTEFTSGTDRGTGGFGSTGS